MVVTQVSRSNSCVDQLPQSRCTTWASRTFKVGVAVTKEALKVTTVVTALSLFTVYAIQPTAFAIAAIIVAPVVEEIVFRGVIQNSIRGTQAIYNRIYPPTDAQIANQRSFRSITTSILFGAAHVTNWSSLGPRCIIQVVHCSISGYQWANTMEKTKSIAWTILEHGINNAFGVCLMLHVGQPAVFLPMLSAYIARNMFNIYSTNRGGITFGGYMGEALCAITGRIFRPVFG